jgi:hypothetical protein
MSRRQSSASREAIGWSKNHSGKKRQMLDPRDLQLVGIRGHSLPPPLEQLLPVQRKPFEQPGEKLLRRAEDVLVANEQLLELLLQLAHARVPDLHGGAVHIELNQVRRRDRHRIRAAEPLAKRLEAVVRRQLVYVEEQVDVRVEVGVAPGAGAREERTPQRAELERRRRHAAGECPDVLGRRVHPRRIVDSTS